MPRPPRYHVPQQVLHAITRGNRRQLIFEDWDDYRRFEEALLAAAASGAFELLAYCLMPNHVHQVARCGEEPIGSALQPVLTAHAVYMNKKYGRTGHLFQGRFKSFPCEEDGRLLELVRYVHMNPVRAGLAAEPGGWAWSSHRDYAGPISRAGVSTGLVFGILGAQGAAANARYEAFMADAPAPLGRNGGDLGALASVVEREGGHDKGFMMRGARCRAAVSLRSRFVKTAQARGYSNKSIADFLGCAESNVTWLSRHP